jgi:peptide deformylase
VNVILDTDDNADVLRRAAARVEIFDKALSGLVEQMLALAKLKDAVGLSAPQVGVSQRVFVVRYGAPIVAVNPAVEPMGAETDEMLEGCLSIEGVAVSVKRWTHVKLSAQSARGKPFVLFLSKDAARIAQHENDHLNGILITDYAYGGKLASLSLGSCYDDPTHGDRKAGDLT